MFHLASVLKPDKSYIVYVYLFGCSSSRENISFESRYYRDYIEGDIDLHILVEFLQ